MVTHAFLEEQGQDRQEPELALLALSLPERGIPVTRFTAKQLAGFVLESTADFWQAAGVSRSLPVWCSEVVAWRSEWRVFVLDSALLDIRHYAGDSTVVPSPTVIEQALATLTESKTHFRAYAIDFGVLESGQTALVEVNDGFSLGCYGLASALYTDLAIARWEELTVGAT